MQAQAAADDDADCPSLAAYAQLKGGFHDWAGNRLRFECAFELLPPILGEAGTRYTRTAMEARAAESRASPPAAAVRPAPEVAVQGEQPHDGIDLKLHIGSCACCEASRGAQRLNFCVRRRRAG